MSTSISMKELLNMTAEELRKEVNTHEREMQAMRVNIRIKKEKDTAKYRRSRKDVARMKHALTLKMNSAPVAPAKKSPEALPKKPKSRKVSAPKSLRSDSGQA
jgi:ribosomal protein L29